MKAPTCRLCGKSHWGLCADNMPTTVNTGKARRKAASSFDKAEQGDRLHSTDKADMQQGSKSHHSVGADARTDGGSHGTGQCVANAETSVPNTGIPNAQSEPLVPNTQVPNKVARWKAANRERYNAYQREYMRQYRARRR